MYVFSGGSMPTLAMKLHARGLWTSLRPGDARPGGRRSLPRESVELLVGAELTRRAFTNACNAAAPGFALGAGVGGVE